VPTKGASSGSPGTMHGVHGTGMAEYQTVRCCGPKTHLCGNVCEPVRGNPEEEPMESRITRAKSCSPILHRCVVNLLGATRAVVSICVGLTFCSPVLEAWALPTAIELLQELQLSDSDRQSIQEGKIVT
jgi:hypothetical protein